MKSRQKINILLCAGALILGGLVYILFREHTYIARLFGELYFTQEIRRLIEEFSCGFLKYYLPDCLWSFALGCGLCAIYANSTVLCGFAAGICGILWELLQYFNIIGGTGDIWDVVMYFAGGICCIIINLRR